MTTIRKSFIRPRSRALLVAQWVILGNLVQLTVGTVILLAQPNLRGTDTETVEIERLKMDLDANKWRITNLEHFDTPTRIAVLETRMASIEIGVGEIKKAGDQIKNIAYGALVTIFVSVIAQFIQIRDQRRLKSEE